MFIWLFKTTVKHKFIVAGCVCVFVCFIEHSEHMKESQTNRNTYPFYVLVQCFIEMWQTLTFTFGAKRRFFAVEPRHK